MNDTKKRLEAVEQELRDLRRRVDELERRKPVRLAQAKSALL
jgi:hypothetical protein